MKSVTLRFSIEEYAQRVASVREHMREKNVDLLLIDQTEFLFYLTGFGLSLNMYRACLLPLEGDPVMIFRGIDQSTFEETSWLKRCVLFSDWEDPVSVVAQTITREFSSQNLRIGIDEDSYCMTLKRFREFQSLLPHATWVDFSGVLEEVRECKSEQEIAYLREAGRIADLGLEAILANTGAGKTERQAAAIVSRVFLENGADNARSAIITSGVGNSFLHGHLHDTPLKEGDIMHMELLPYLHGYSARLMRPAVIGDASPEQRRAAELMLEIQDRQFASIRPGALASEVDAIARDAMLSHGLRESYINITGYSLGHYPASSPHTSDFSRVFLPKASWKLKPGMVFHMYLSASGLGFSETIAVTSDGYERLTPSTRKMFVV
ncbi:M24 family metallopeptidase [Paraburkholderia tropica]|uniref:M24 family metallopeptidase n=1 Tax=Paraburkholderia tropica TaxID=92647 RepID=UPI002AB659A7|nr:Xaa-Pro peptidase family protein [Paraburkholderia tropica]